MNKSKIKIDMRLVAHGFGGDYIIDVVSKDIPRKILGKVVDGAHPNRIGHTISFRAADCEVL